MPDNIATRFSALCLACAWEGPLRSSNLVALGDWDSHVRTPDHILAITAAPDLGDEPDEPASPFATSLAILDEATI